MGSKGPLVLRRRRGQGRLGKPCARRRGLFHRIKLDRIHAPKRHCVLMQTVDAVAVADSMPTPSVNESTPLPVRCSLLACRAHLRRQVKSNLTSKWTAGARTHCVTDSLPSTTTPATRDLVAGSSARRPTCTPARQVKSSQLDLTLRQVSHSEIADAQQIQGRPRPP